MTTGVLLLWSVIASLVLYLRGNTIAELQYKLTSITADIDRLNKQAQIIRNQAEDELKNARAIAAGIVRDAEATRREAEGFLLREQQEMQRIYPKLTKYQPGKNEVNQEYLEAFEVTGDRIKTFMRNRPDATEIARPRFTIFFLTKYGFVTESFNKTWLFDSMRPGEYRIDDDSGISWRAGEPIYYMIRFDN